MPRSESTSASQALPSGLSGTASRRASARAASPVCHSPMPRRIVASPASYGIVDVVDGVECRDGERAFGQPGVQSAAATAARWCTESSGPAAPASAPPANRSWPRRRGRVRGPADPAPDCGAGSGSAPVGLLGELVGAVEILGRHPVDQGLVEQGVALGRIGRDRTGPESMGRGQVVAPRRSSPVSGPDQLCDQCRVRSADRCGAVTEPTIARGPVCRARVQSLPSAERKGVVDRIAEEGVGRGDRTVAGPSSAIRPQRRHRPAGRRRRPRRCRRA